jgi:transglutaminase-like putative cysteine protease
MIYRATHITRHFYEEPVSQCLNELRLTPRQTPGQRVHRASLTVEPEAAVVHERRDYFGNGVATIAIFEKHDRLIITAESVVEVAPAPADYLLSLPWEAARDQLASLPDHASMEASEFVFDSPFVAAGPDLAAYARPSFPPGRPLLEAAHDLSHRIHTDFEYKPKSTSIDMPLGEVLRNRRGVCQDFAHVMIGALRSQRLAARYVSGYLRSGANSRGAEASHAWVSVFLPGTGWGRFDPTHDVMPGDGHVTLAWGRDYGDVAPVKGITLGGGGQLVEVEVRVEAV